MPQKSREYWIENVKEHKGILIKQKPSKDFSDIYDWVDAYWIERKPLLLAKQMRNVFVSEMRQDGWIVEVTEYKNKV